MGFYHFKDKTATQVLVGATRRKYTRKQRDERGNIKKIVTNPFTEFTSSAVLQESAH